MFKIVNHGEAEARQKIEAKENLHPPCTHLTATQHSLETDNTIAQFFLLKLLENYSAIAKSCAPNSCAFSFLVSAAARDVPVDVHDGMR